MHAYNETEKSIDIMAPAISVVMSVYKEPEAWLREAVESILGQTFRDFEFLIINDCPGREVNVCVLAEYASRDQRVRVITNERNLGLPTSLNIGLRAATGKYIARMDADDISLPGRFAAQYEFMEAHAEVGVCGSNVLCFGKMNKVRRYPATHEDMFVFCVFPFAHPSVMIRRVVLVDNNIEYDEHFRNAQDQDLWTRLYPVTRFANIQCVLLHYRISDQQITTAMSYQQSQYSAKTFPRAFRSFCELHKLPYVLRDPIDVNVLRACRVYLANPRPFPVARFLPIVYRGVTNRRLRAFAYLFFSGDAWRMSLRNVMKVIACLTVYRKKPPFIDFHDGFEGIRKPINK